MEPIHLMKASTQKKPNTYGIFEYGKLDDIFSQITLISYLFRIWAPLLSNDSLNKDWTPQATIFASLIKKYIKLTLCVFLGQGDQTSRDVNEVAIATRSNLVWRAGACRIGNAYYVWHWFQADSHISSDKRWSLARRGLQCLDRMASPFGNLHTASR